jgi:phospholipid/cholesterol/gamma-HCH transport system substrate-binding protein
VSHFYKDQLRTEIRVGIATVLGLLLLIGGYAWLRHVFENRHQQTVFVRFAHAANLEPGDEVSVFGVRSGKVKSLKVDQTGVTAQIEVRYDYPLHTGTRFIIKENDLMGGRGIDILPGQEPGLLDPKSICMGEIAPDISTMMVQLSGVMTRADSLLASLNGTDRIVADLSEMADSSKALVRSTSRLIGQTGNDVRVVLASIADNSRELSGIMAENRGAISRSFTSLDELLAGLRTDFSRLDRIVARADTISAGVNRGDNTVGRLLRDRELYDHLLKSSTELDSLLKDVRKNPKRYFKFSVF